MAEWHAMEDPRVCRAIGGVDLVGDSWRPTVMALTKTSSAFCYSYQLMSSLYLLVANDGAMASWLLTARIQDWRSAPSYLGLSFINLVQCALARPPLSASCHPYYRFVPADGMSGMHQSPWRTSSCTHKHLEIPMLIEERRKIKITHHCHYKKISLKYLFTCL